VSELDDIITAALAEITGEGDTAEAQASEDDAAQPVVAEDQVEEQSPEGTEPTEETQEAEDTDGGPLEVDLDTLIKLPDGRVVNVKDGIELKADYTRKTQELATQRREVEDVYTQLMQWRDSVLAEPKAFVAELIAANAAEPADLAGEVLFKAADPTAALARVIKQMLDGGALSEDFIEAFGLEAPDHTVRAKAKSAEDESRLERLERELAERRAAEESSAAQAQLLASYERQIDEIISTEGLNTTDRDDLIVELVSFAQESGLVDNLAHAYAVLSRNKEREAAAAAKVAAERAAAKRAVRVMAPTGASTAGKSVQPTSYDTYESAASAALAELTKRWDR
jgi:hypothetical protein